MTFKLDPAFAQELVDGMTGAREFQISLGLRKDGVFGRTFLVVSLVIEERQICSTEVDMTDVSTVTLPVSVPFQFQVNVG